MLVAYTVAVAPTTLVLGTERQKSELPFGWMRRLEHGTAATRVAATAAAVKNLASMVAMKTERGIVER
jgi:hypothetical protein